MRKLRPRIWQGDISDLNLLKLREVREKYGLSLAVNVGSTNFVPPDMWAVHLPMLDDPQPGANEWLSVLTLARMVASTVEFGGAVLITCDAGISRSVTFAGLVISLLEHREMDEDLLREIQHPAHAPLRELWENAKRILLRWPEA